MLLVLVIVACDAFARWSGVYRGLDEHWPARWRLRAQHRANERAPYRQGDHGDWEMVRPAGIPRAMSSALLPMVGVALMWSVACALSFGDVFDVFAGRRTLARTAAVLALVWTRSTLSWLSLAFGYTSSTRKRLGAGLADLALDVALWRVAIPCSDFRADDERVGLAGALIGAIALVTYAWSTRPIAKTTEVDPAQLARMN